MQFILFYLLGLGTLTLISFGYRFAFLAYFASDFVHLSLTQKAYALFWGLKFDLAIAGTLTGLIIAIVYLGLRLTKLRKTWAYLYIPAIIAIITTMAADMMYYADAARHISYEISDTMVDFGSIIETAFSQHLWLTITSFALIPIISICLLYLLKKFAAFKAKLSFKQLELPLLLLLAISILANRGGITRAIPIAPHDAYQIGSSDEATIALSGSYSSLYYLLYNRGKLQQHTLPSISRSALITNLQQLYPQHNNRLQISHLKKMNVIVVMLESWPAMYMQSYGYNQDVTPEFDKLRKKSFSTMGMIASGHRTTEGMFATFCSYPNPLGHTIAKTQLMYMQYHCLPAILRNKGWSTAFIEGTNADTSAVGSLAQSLGFKYSYGLADIHQHKLPENHWGVQDPDQYDFIMHKVQSMKQPFFIGINTTSTHDDVLPPKVKPAFGMQTHQEQQISLLHFADKALGHFVHNYLKQKHLRPTLFVIEADHTAGLEGVSRFQQHFIPFIVFSTDDKIKPQKVNMLVSQRDIAPTIINFLGGNIPWFTGKSVLNNNTAVRFADYFISDVIGWIEKDRLVEINLDNNHLTCYLWHNNYDQHATTTCTPLDKTLEQHALAFVNHTQDLLFSGKTYDFFKGIAKK